jgi:hypothetical protein
MLADLKTSLEKLSATTKAARLRALMPLIEAKLAEGVRHAEIVLALNEQGFTLTEKTYRNYVHRQRKQCRATPSGEPGVAAPAHAATLAPPMTSGVVAPATSPPISSVKVGPKRPPTFEHDPRGIPDLLK